MARSAATSYVPVLHPRHRLIGAILAAQDCDLPAPLDAGLAPHLDSHCVIT